MTALKERHRHFVEEFMKNGGNGTAAARAAGFSGNDAALATRASELLKRKDVRAAMNERVANDPLVADREERLRFWTRKMRGVDKKGRAVKTPENIQMEGAKQLGRACGDFIERHEHKHEGQVQIVMPSNGRDEGT